MKTFTPLSRRQINRGSLDLVFDGVTPLDPRLIFTSTGARTCVNAAGQMVLAPQNVLRIGYDMVGLTPYGAQLEASFTNVLLNSLLDGTPLSTQTVTTTAASWTFNFYGAGTVTLSGAATATIVGTADNVLTTATVTATAGSCVVTVSGTVKWANFVAGIDPLGSFIPTSGSPAARATETLMMPLVNAPWFNPVEGTFVIIGRTGTPLTNTALRLDDGTDNNRIMSRASGSANNQDFRVLSGGASVCNLETGNTASVGARYRHVIGYKANDFASAFNNANLLTDSVGAVPVGMTRMGIGCDLATSIRQNGFIERITYYPTRFNNAYHLEI